MGVEEAICMKAGSGETSYANNSVFQKSIIDEVRPMLEESIRAIFESSSTPVECLTIADLGCSTGPNTLGVLRSVIDVSVSTCQISGIEIPEFNALMNDLPQNDFNTVFKSLPDFYKKIEEEQGVEISCFINGTPGSFQGRLFPRKSVHFMHSSTAVHFLSQVPKGVMGRDGKEVLNRGCVYVSKSSPPEFLKAFQHQFCKDFTLFLRCRYEELVDRGELLITLPCTLDDQLYPVSEFIHQALNKLAFQGRIDKEKLDAFNLPIYMPTIPKVKQIIEDEGSFTLHKYEAFTVKFNATMKSSENVDVEARQVDNNRLYSDNAKRITNSLRAGLESMLASEFGEEVMDSLFSSVEDMAIDSLATGEEVEILNVALSLRKSVSN